MTKVRTRVEDQSNPSDTAGAVSDDGTGADHIGRYSADRVALRAYELYLARGGSDGQDFDDWLAAERELSIGAVPEQTRRMMADRRQPFVLVADDDRDTRELYRACFDTNGYRTAEAGTGPRPSSSAVEIVPDVLLTDYVLPDVDGLTIARRLKADGRTAAIRILMVTGYANAGPRTGRRSPSASIVCSSNPAFRRPSCVRCRARLPAPPHRAARPSAAYRRRRRRASAMNSARCRLRSRERCTGERYRRDAPDARGRISIAHLAAHRRDP